MKVMSFAKYLSVLLRYTTPKFLIEVENDEIMFVLFHFKSIIHIKG